MSGSVFFPEPERRRRRPKSAGASVKFSMSVDPAVDLIVRREAAANGVSAAWVYHEAAKRFGADAYNEREKGLLPVPAVMATEELDLIRRQAEAAGMSMQRWVSHTLLDGVARRALGAGTKEQDQAA